MSEHVRRAEPSYLSLYIFLIGLLCVIVVYMFEAYSKQRIVYVQATPKNAQLYVDNGLVCKSLPCEIEMQNWPKELWIKKNRHYSQQIPISPFKYFTSERLSYDIHLKAFPERPVEPEMTPQKPRPALPPQTHVPEREYPAIPSTPKPKPILQLPIACQETTQERQAAQNRQAVLCYYGDDKAVSLNVAGECYATYWVSVAGRVKNLHGFGCMHDALLEPARKAFENRIYLPALKNGKPVEGAINGEIRYGVNTTYAAPLESDRRPATPINGDARISSCPPVEPPNMMTRSGHCIFVFDLTPEAVISKVRQIKCTDAVLKSVTLASLNECSFKPAMTDGSAISRLYMTHQIDVDVYNSKREKIPVHAAFGEKNVNKPYVVFD